MKKDPERGKLFPDTCVRSFVNLVNGIDLSLSIGSLGVDAPAAAFGKTAALEDV